MLTSAVKTEKSAVGMLIRHRVKSVAHGFGPKIKLPLHRSLLFPM